MGKIQKKTLMYYLIIYLIILLLTYLTGVSIIGYGVINTGLGIKQLLSIHIGLGIFDVVIGLSILFLKLKRLEFILGVINLITLSIAAYSGISFLQTTNLFWVFVMETAFIISLSIVSLIIGLSLTSEKKVPLFKIIGFIIVGLIISYIGGSLIPGYVVVSNQLNKITMVTPSKTTTSVYTTTSGKNISVKLPKGSIPLPYNPSNKTVYLYLVTFSNSTLFNYNGTSDGNMKIYIPANWSILIKYTNYESIQHSVALVLNYTMIPTNPQLSQDGKILYELNLVSDGESTVGIIDNIPAGYYWLACPVFGHASSGLWADLIVSNNVTVPYVIIQ